MTQSGNDSVKPGEDSPGDIIRAIREYVLIQSVLPGGNAKNLGVTYLGLPVPGGLTNFIPMSCSRHQEKIALTNRQAALQRSPACRVLYSFGPGRAIRRQRVGLK